MSYATREKDILSHNAQKPGVQEGKDVTGPKPDRGGKGKRFEKG
jgi:hypothetical protein